MPVFVDVGKVQGGAFALDSRRRSSSRAASDVPADVRCLTA